MLVSGQARDDGHRLPEKTIQYVIKYSAKVALRTALLTVLVWPLSGIAQPFGYAVNSDASTNADRLLEINLSNGQSRVIGDLPAPLTNIEGLALNSSGDLFGVDAVERALFRIDLNDASAVRVGELGFPPGEQFDFGLTFSCSNQLLLAAEQRQSLYRVDTTTGQANIIGNSGGLGQNVTALATFRGEVFGLAADTNSIHRINSETASAQLIGNIGQTVTDAGLAFDSAGTLWAILDATGTGGPAPSQIVRIDPTTGSGTVTGTTVDGIESLAITAPSGCPAQVSVNSPWFLLVLLLAVLGVGSITARRIELR